MLAQYDARQQAIAAQFEALAQRKLALVEQIATTRKTAGADAALKLILSDEGRTLMDSIRSVAARMKVDGMQELTARESSSRADALRIQAFSVGFVATAVSAVLVVLFLLIRTRRLRSDMTERPASTPQS